jgi:transcriptional regulator with XRE-family HTH domain
MAKRLSELQYAAIEFLALPKRGGLTYEQVAEKVGITDRTLRDWRKDDAFNDELKRQVVRNCNNARSFVLYKKKLGKFSSKMLREG